MVGAIVRHNPALAALARCRKGSTAVEFSVLAGPLLLLLLGTIEFGRALWTLNELSYSVDEAARCAAINSTLCPNIQAFAANQSSINFSTSVFTVSTTACGHQVSASYPMQLYIPFVNYSITLTAQSCYPV